MNLFICTFTRSSCYMNQSPCTLTYVATVANYYCTVKACRSGLNSTEAWTYVIVQVLFKTGAPIGAWIFHSPPFLGQTDRPTNQNQQTTTRVIGKLRFQSVVYREPQKRDRTEGGGRILKKYIYF